MSTLTARDVDHIFESLKLMFSNSKMWSRNQEAQYSNERKGSTTVLLRQRMNPNRPIAPNTEDSESTLLRQMRKKERKKTETQSQLEFSQFKAKRTLV